MTDREMMQQWLDAIAAIPEDVEGYLPDALTDLVIATRERLAQPDHDWEAEYTKQVELHNQTLDELRDALAQPEQEPVAWADPKDLSRKGHDLWVSTERVDHYTAPLYTAPPRREWVGLTDEDRVELWADSANIAGFGGMKFEHIRAVEAKLKEKNT